MVARVALACGFAIALPAHALTFSPLGYTGGMTSEPSAVSADGGVVVGRVFLEVDEDGQGSGVPIVFRWQNDFMQAPLAGCSSYEPRVSDDGRTVAADCRLPSFRPAVWKDDGLLEVSTDTTLSATDVSGDGALVFGHRPHIIDVPFGDDLEHIEAARLTGGVTPMGILAGDNWSEVVAVSRDGSVVGVKSQFRDHSGDEPVEILHAARWDGGALTDLGNLGFDDASIADVSSDGGTIVGWLDDYLNEDDVLVRAFRRTAAGGMVDIGYPPGGNGAKAFGVSGDGSIIVGAWGGPATETARAMIWTAADGPRDLQAVFEDEFAYDLGGWTLIAATAVSSDGSTVAGIGIDPQTQRLTGWIASLRGQLVVDLRAYDSAGNPLDGQLTLEENIDVDLVIANQTGRPLGDFLFANGQPLSVDGRSTGGVQLLSGPTPILTADGLTLAPGETRTVRYRMTTNARGIAAVHAKMSALDDEGREHSDGHSLRLGIEDTESFLEQLKQYLFVLALDRAMVEIERQLQERLRAVSQLAREKLAKILKPEKAQQWLGLPDDFGGGVFERAQAALSGLSSEGVDVRLPDGEYRGHTVEELNAEYNETFFDEVGKGVGKYVDRWATFGGKAKRAAKEAWSDTVNTAGWLLGDGTAEQRKEWAARAMQRANQIDSANALFIEFETNLVREVNAGARDIDPVIDATSKKAVDLFNRKMDELNAWRAADDYARQKLLKIADKDPVRFQREWAKLDAELVNTFMPVLLDTLVGGTLSRGVGGVAKMTARGRGAAMLESGKAAGVLDETGAVTRSTAIEAADASVPHGISATDAARTSEEFLSNLDGATVLQSTDLGNVYELPNLGGVPEITLDAKAGILQSLESEFAAVKGRDITLVEVLKPSSALRKPGGVAKLELTGQKTGKPSMIDGGMPAEALGEASVWRNTTPPSELPGFGDLPTVRQEAAIKEWELANERWAEWHAPAAGSKTARLKECLGQEGRVPLDNEPNAGGLQRFVRAHFEEVTVQKGSAEAKLIRVKKYEIEVVDTRSGRVVNGKSVVDSPEALPQTPDADAVAVGKVVGTDAQGRPIIEPLSREEREFVMQRYIDKNVKARKSGQVPDLAEHGVTLVMDDASAAAAGSLVPKYGAPFLPEAIGIEHLRRIAPFVKPNELSDIEMVEKMLQYVQAEGGFGQHAIVLTRDARFLGEVPFASW